MRAIYTIFFFIFSLSFTNITFGQTEKTLVKSFNLQGMDVVALDVKGDIDVQQWNNKTLRVQMTISVENIKEATLKSLVVAKRYNLISKMTDEEYLISVPGLQREVTIGGEPLKEAISYVVYVPDNVFVKLQDSSSTSINP